MTDDWHFLNLAQGGDEEAWRILFQRYYPPLVRIASCITGSHDTARDLAQESFVRLIRARISHQNGSFGAYLTTITYHLALKESRRLRATDPLEDIALPDNTPSPLQQIIRRDGDRMVFRAIRSLPIEQREIVALRFFGGHSYEKIAEITGVPIGTVKSRIFYAIKKCRERLKEEGIFP